MGATSLENVGDGAAPARAIPGNVTSINPPARKIWVVPFGAARRTFLNQRCKKLKRRNRQQRHRDSRCAAGAIGQRKQNWIILNDSAIRQYEQAALPIDKQWKYS